MSTHIYLTDSSLCDEQIVLKGCRWKGLKISGNFGLKDSSKRFLREEICKVHVHKKL